jgi:signal transduction histidine kinase
MIQSMTPLLEGIGKRDVALALLFTAVGMALMVTNVSDGEIAASPLAVPLFLLVTLPVLWRRVAPVTVAGLVTAAWLLHLALFGPDVIRCGVVLPIVLVLAFTAGAELTGRAALATLALAIAVIVGEGVVYIGVGFSVVIVGVAGALFLTGRLVRSRRQLAGELELRSHELRRARDERARLEVQVDRERLSTELDALLQRRLGELARLADAGAGTAEPAVATATLADIERESRRTLDEMRALVGALRSDDDAPTQPQPTLAHLEAMLLRAKGDHARLRVEGSPRVLPAGVELSAFRVVEHLLDGVESAPDVDVLVRFADDALEIAVTGAARRRAKASIERARERVRLQHGTLEATVRGGRAEALVSLPVATAG